MARKLIVIAFFALLSASQAQADVENFKGMYRGEYEVGDYSGIWRMYIDTYGDVSMNTRSNNMNVETAGFGDLYGGGAFVIHLDNGVMIIGNISEDGAVEGVWSDPQIDTAGTMEGSCEVAPEEEEKPEALKVSKGFGGCFISTINYE